MSFYVSVFYCTAARRLMTHWKNFIMWVWLDLEITEIIFIESFSAELFSKNVFTQCLESWFCKESRISFSDLKIRVLASPLSLVVFYNIIMILPGEELNYLISLVALIQKWFPQQNCLLCFLLWSFYKATHVDYDLSWEECRLAKIPNHTNKVLSTITVVLTWDWNKNYMYLLINKKRKEKTVPKNLNQIYSKTWIYLGFF